MNNKCQCLFCWHEQFSQPKTEWSKLKQVENNWKKLKKTLNKLKQL